ncbi:MAG: hypothetical protein ACKVOO_08945 [Burkholderiaceae bacterium]
MKRLLISLGLMGCAVFANAAGGHFDVDDAGLLDPGRCQLELWSKRSRSADESSLHAGPACRIGPVELGLNLDSSRAAGVRERSVGPQIKWSVDAAEDVSLGVVVATAYSAGTHRSTHTVYAPLTWQASDTLSLHLNAGADRAPGQRRTLRTGLGGEWALSDQFTLLAERIRFAGSMVTRLGLRVHLGEAVSLDFSTAHVRGSGGPVLSLGLSQEFGR